MASRDSISAFPASRSRLKRAVDKSQSAPPHIRKVERFAHGIELSDFTCQPARLHRLEDGDTPLYEVCLREGKFHQVKRMFAAVGSEVTALCRTGFGPLLLPDTLEQGQCRSLTREETEALLKSGK